MIDKRKIFALKNLPIISKIIHISYKIIISLIITMCFIMRLYTSNI